MRLSRLAAFAAAGFAASFAPTTRRASAQQPPAVHPLGAIVATSADTVASHVSARVLPHGRVLVNDLGNQRLLLFDSTLQQATVLADTTEATSHAYGRGLADLLPFNGDSSLVTDVSTNAFVVLDGNGKIARVIPPAVRQGRGPGPVRLGALIGYDMAGHLLYRQSPPIFLSLLPPEFFGDSLMTGPDTTALLRRSVADGHVDTLTLLKAARIRQAVSRPAPGAGRGFQAFNPIPAADDWAVTPNGVVGVVRVGDFHVDWIQPNSHVTSGDKLPVQWVRITDSMKVAIMDSVRRRDGNVALAGSTEQAFGQRIAFVVPSDLPDVWPPFVNRATLADADGNLWIHEARPGGAMSNVFYVVDRRGRLTDRISVAQGAVVAFGPRVAYLTVRGADGNRLVRALIH